MILAILITSFTFVLSGALHYVIVSSAIRYLGAATYHRGCKLVIALCVSGIAHIGAVSLYALAYGAGRALGIGDLRGETPATAMDVFYFSLVSYTSLGLGDIVPTGHLRLIAGVEALNGFLLISCSAAMLFLFIRDGDKAKSP
ncbi:MAG: potassium channel family protein [Hyphomonas sp.]|uniref:potassium channel family protein n=1 Tax=Hyphomonas adhaerens TaxID=81029 RepID=UPI002356F116|nr:potassium channel family protein [Hyphomonas adhaerens]|tara:strand:- start:230 stop:658 length:429 start_codon:yes stop_codon:yes gene_type:complete